MCVEVGILVFALAGVAETARRRGLPGWPFGLLGFIAWLAGGLLAGFLATRGVPSQLAPLWSWGALGLVFLSTFVIGGGGRQRKGGTWRCPDCLAFNPPSTLVCLCGHNPDRPAEGEASR